MIVHRSLQPVVVFFKNNIYLVSFWESGVPSHCVLQAHVIAHLAVSFGVTRSRFTVCRQAGSVQNC